MSEKIMILLENHQLEEIKNLQMKILAQLNSAGAPKKAEQYISRHTAAELFDCDCQTINNLEKEGLIKRYGRGKLIRYSKLEILNALQA